MSMAKKASGGSFPTYYPQTRELGYLSAQTGGERSTKSQNVNVNGSSWQALPSCANTAKSIEPAIERCPKSNSRPITGRIAGHLRTTSIHPEPRTLDPTPAFFGMEDLQMHFESSVLGAYNKSLGTHRDRVAIATETCWNISVGGQKSVWQVHFLRSLKRVGSIRRDGEASNENDERAGCQHGGGGVVVSSPWQVSGREMHVHQYQGRLGYPCKSPDANPDATPELLASRVIHRRNGNLIIILLHLRVERRSGADGPSHIGDVSCKAPVSGAWMSASETPKRLELQFFGLCARMGSGYGENDSESQGMRVFGIMRSATVAVGKYTDVPFCTSGCIDIRDRISNIDVTEAIAARQTEMCGVSAPLARVAEKFGSMHVARCAARAHVLPWSRLSGMPAKVMRPVPQGFSDFGGTVAPVEPASVKKEFDSKPKAIGVPIRYGYARSTHIARLVEFNR
ncbi:hypothetical protein B0H14DRAFT_3163368 [Mycena olivaceomarginata]|nr:hypothetical protein B0H14DRAFT_3163368 [Mycena olivaceomarginata]